MRGEVARAQQSLFFAGDGDEQHRRRSLAFDSCSMRRDFEIGCDAGGVIHGAVVDLSPLMGAPTPNDPGAR